MLAEIRRGWLGISATHLAGVLRVGTSPMDNAGRDTPRQEALIWRCDTLRLSVAGFAAPPGEMLYVATGRKRALRAKGHSGGKQAAVRDTKCGVPTSFVSSVLGASRRRKTYAQRASRRLTRGRILGVARQTSVPPMSLLGRATYVLDATHLDIVFIIDEFAEVSLTEITVRFG